MYKRAVYGFAKTDTAIAVEPRRARELEALVHSA